MPEGTPEDDTDQDGGMPEDEEDNPPCTPSDILRSRTEDLGGDIQTR